MGEVSYSLAPPLPPPAAEKESLFLLFLGQILKVRVLVTLWRPVLLPSVCGESLRLDYSGRLERTYVLPCFLPFFFLLPFSLPSDLSLCVILHAHVLFAELERDTQEMQRLASAMSSPTAMLASFFTSSSSGSSSSSSSASSPHHSAAASGSSQSVSGSREPSAVNAQQWPYIASYFSEMFSSSSPPRDSSSSSSSAPSSSSSSFSNAPPAPSYSVLSAHVSTEHSLSEDPSFASFSPDRSMVGSIGDEEDDEEAVTDHRLPVADGAGGTFSFSAGERAQERDSWKAEVLGGHEVEEDWRGLLRRSVDILKVSRGRGGMKLTIACIAEYSQRNNFILVCHLETHSLCLFLVFLSFCSFYFSRPWRREPLS